MAEFSIDRFVDLYARRAAGMSASEVRALFAVAARPDVVSLAGGMPFVQAIPPGDVLRVVTEALAEEGAAALQYGGGQGRVSLRERLVPLMAEEGVEADPEDMVITTGAQQALDLVAKIFIDPGDEIVVEAPAYVGALSAFGAYEPRYLQVDLDGDGMVVEQLEQLLLGGHRPKFVYTVPNFGNPAGVTLSYSRRERLVSLCREAGIPILEDNPYGMLRFEGDALPCLRTLDPDNVIYLGTVSKVFSPGVRVGWALGEQSVIQRLILAKEAADLCGSSFTMSVTERYFAGDRWRANLSELVDIYRSRRDAMLDALAEHFPTDATWTHPAGGFYVWVTLPPYLDAHSMLAAAVEHKVAYVPGTAFYPDGRGNDQMRLAFCYPPEERIREGIARLGSLLREQEERYRSLHPPEDEPKNEPEDGP
jgi:DNA-binding transcriptional MocR family regulator